MLGKSQKVVFLYLLTWQEKSKGGAKLLTEKTEHILSQTNSFP